MSRPEPGEDGVPYTHREIFFAAALNVGKGMATYGELEEESLINSNTLEDVKETPDAMKSVRQSKNLVEECVISDVVDQIAYEEMSIAYAASNSTGELPKDIQKHEDFNEYSNIENLNKEQIEWVLAVVEIIGEIPDDLRSELVLQKSNWADYYTNLLHKSEYITDLGDEASNLVAYLLSDEIETVSDADIFDVIKDESDVDHFAKEENELLETNPVNEYVPDEFEGFVNKTEYDIQEAHFTNPFSTHSFRDSEFENEAAVGFLHISNTLRRAVAATRFDMGGEFKFVYVNNGELTDNFWEIDWNDEYYKTVTQEQREDDGSGFEVEAVSHISTDGDLILEGEPDTDGEPGRALDVAASARIITHEFGVSENSEISVEVHGDTNTDSSSSTSGEASTSTESDVVIGVGDDVRVYKGGSTPSSTETFDVTNKDYVNIRLEANADADADSNNPTDDFTSSESPATLRIQNIDIS